MALDYLCPLSYLDYSLLQSIRQAPSERKTDRASGKMMAIFSLIYRDMPPA
jgi:hypothetical protein